MLVCSILVITEVLSKKGSSLDSINKLPIRWITTDKNIANIAGLLRQRYSTLKTPDAVHIATAASVKAERFVTNDQVILDIKKVDDMIIWGLK